MGAQRDERRAATGRRGALAERIRRWATLLVTRFDLVGALLGLVGAFVITLVALAIVVFVAELNSANRDVAIGDVFAGGVFLLAIVAAVVSVLAYAQSSRRPSLKTGWSFWDLEDDTLILEQAFPRDPSVRDFMAEIPAAARGRDLVPLKPAKLWVELANVGGVAAKNAALLFRLEGIYFSPAPEIDPKSRWRFYSADKGSKIQWEAGSDHVIYSDASADAPSNMDINLTGMWAVSEIAHTDWGAVVTYADDLREPQTETLQIDPAPLPPRASPA